MINDFHLIIIGFPVQYKSDWVAEMTLMFRINADLSIAIMLRCCFKI